MKVKVSYTIAELCSLTGWSRWKMVRCLRANGVELHKSGPRGRMVMLSQIRKYFPDLWDSILDALRLNDCA